jgi:ParB family chromosome partitioning protein
VSKADQLGSGAAFGRARTARSSRRDAYETSIRGENAATAALTDLPVTLISDNPDNPRNHLRALDETVESVRELGVILPIVVATTEAYLHDRPDRAGDLDDGTQYVVIDGHRRLEAARRVGLAMIPVRVDNARVATDEALLEAAFVANYHRDDMTDLEEAHALKSLVDYYGSQSKAAKRLGIPQATISTKLSLLKLSPELQKDLVTGERKVEHVRNLGKLTPDEQKAKADERAEAARRKAQQRPDVPLEREAGPADYHGVIIPETPSAGAEQRTAETSLGPGTASPTTGRDQPVPYDREADHARPPSAPPAPPATVPQQHPERHAEVPAGTRLPYDDGARIGHHLVLKLSDAEFDRMMAVLDEHRAKRIAHAG